MASSYVDPIDAARLRTDSVKAVLSDLDAHSDLLEAEAYRAFLRASRAEYTGIGVDLRLEGDLLKVVSVVEGGPASLAGIMAGDSIVAVDGMALTSANGHGVQHLSSPPDGFVSLLVARAGHDLIEVVLRPALVRVPTLMSRLEHGRIGYARIFTFA
jgi:carboxyl-terminal processing protease